MEAIELLTGYADKLKRSEKLLKSLERKAKALAGKQAETDETRMYLEASITDHQRDTAALLSERQDLQLEYIGAVYEQDAAAQREIQSRRGEIDAELEQHQTDIRRLRTALAELPSYDTEAAQIAAEIDKLQFGDAFRFARQLEPVLINNQRTLESRREQARGKLPAYTEKVYREVRSSQDQDYARKLSEDVKYQETQARIQRQKQERSKLSKSEVRDQNTGYLLGWNIKNENNEVIRFEKVKKQPIASS